MSADRSRDSTEHGDRPSFRRKPPVAPERVEVLKANYKQAWLYFLLVISLVVAWGIPIRYAIIRWVAFRPDDRGPLVARSFVALAYEGISDNPTEISSRRFQEHMSMLEENGYHAITLEDVNAFYREGQLLPDKAVLLTFDHSRKSSYFDARKLLRKMGWPAVMFIWTKPIEDEDPSALRWPYVRDMVRSGAWEAGAQSHAGFEQIVTDRSGATRNFMASPQWLPEKQRYETPSEFQSRLRDDHLMVRTWIEKETGQSPRAFAFPYGDFGQYDERATLSRRFNLDLVSEHYDLGFIHGGLALNTLFTDSRRLNRLLVRPEWSAEDLRIRLENSWPRDRGLTGKTGVEDPQVWLREWGELEFEEEGVSIAATEETTGAKAWLKGTDLYQDFRARFHLDPVKGQTGIYLRASPDGESFLYVGLGDAGEVWLRQKHTGLEAFTLGTSRYLPEEDGSVVLEVFLRGNLFAANTNGQALFNEVITTRGSPRPGLVGASVWDPEAGEASTRIHDLQLIPFSTRVVSWEPIPSAEPTLAGWLSSNAYRFTHLAPPWLQMDRRGRAEQMGWNISHFRDLSNVYDMKLTPAVRVTRLEGADPILAKRLAENIAETGVDGIYCDMKDLEGNPPVGRITNWLRMLSEELNEHDKQLIVTLPDALKEQENLKLMFEGFSNLSLAISEESDIFLSGEIFRQSRLVSYKEVTIEAGVYPLKEHLEGLDADQEEWSTEIRGRLLRDEGMAAYRAGQFDLASSLWGRWAELEPYRAEPHRLLGDLYVRTGKYLEAVTSYRQSLSLDPGQVPLVVTTANLQEQFLNQEEEAMTMLSLYHDLFPANSEILLAQAGMLLRMERPEEARARIQRVVELNPNDLDALSMLHRLLQTRRERVENFSRILGVGNRPGMELHLANTLEAYDLLVWPESWRLLNRVEELAALETVEPGQPLGPYRRQLPRKTVVQENFKTGQLSEHWEGHGHDQGGRDGSIYLGARLNTTEAALQLVGSDTMQNGFIECVVEEARGYLWLYARRSEGNMIRYGFDPARKLFMQIWHRGELVANLNREWGKPVDQVRLRLELRGDAAFAYVDGEPAFGSPAEIPKDMNLGWWGLAPWAREFGVAEAVVREIAGGPQPVELGVFSRSSTIWRDRQVSEALKPHAQELSAIAPPWFFQDISGRILAETEENHRETRLRCRFHKIRLLPMIRSVSERVLDLEEVVRLAQRERVDGFTLVFTRLPSEKWFQQAEDVLLDTNLSLIAMQIDEVNEVVKLRELGPVMPLFAGPRVIHTLPLHPLAVDEEDERADPETEPSAQAQEPAEGSEEKPVLSEVESFPPRSQILYFE